MKHDLIHFEKKREDARKRQTAGGSFLAKRIIFISD
jgi:hypothetical protein